MKITKEKLIAEIESAFSCNTPDEYECCCPHGSLDREAFIEEVRAILGKYKIVVVEKQDIDWLEYLAEIHANEKKEFLAWRREADWLEYSDYGKL